MTGGDICVCVWSLEILSGPLLSSLSELNDIK